jgi:GTP cyclohydrolase II
VPRQAAYVLTLHLPLFRQLNDYFKTFWRHPSERGEIRFPYGSMIVVPIGSMNSREGARPTLIMLKQIAEVAFPTRWADFRLFAFEGVRANKKAEAETALALTLGDIHGTPPVVRIHSQCTTGDVFHSMRCDCHDQLHLAMRAIAEQGAGVLVYEHQEGRGIGLMEKLRAYQLQDDGLDTIEANLQLGHEVDLRDYALSVEILRFLKIRSLQLMTNNPEKIDAVRSSGIEIVRRVSADVPGNPHSAHYIATKRDKLGHLSNATAGIFVGNRSTASGPITEAGSVTARSGAATLNTASIPNS